MGKKRKGRGSRMKNLRRTEITIAQEVEGNGKEEEVNFSEVDFSISGT